LTRRRELEAQVQKAVPDLCLQTPPIAGADFPYADVPGAYRNYVKLNGPLTQEVEQANPLEDLADPGCGLHNAEQAVYGNRQVVAADQLAHAGRIDSRNPGQIQHDIALAAPEERPDPVPQLRLIGRAQASFDVQDRAVVRAGRFDGYHGCSRPSDEPSRNGGCLENVHGLIRLAAGAGSFSVVGPRDAIRESRVQFPLSG
jgi:hypothetical protein